MDNQEEQNIEVQSDPYLESPKAFHLEMPLYHVFDLAIGVDAEKVYKLLSYSGTIDAYCIWCDKESVFDTQEHVYSSTAYWEWKKETGFRRNMYRCSRNSNHEYFIYYLKTKDSLLKIGQNYRGRRIQGIHTGHWAFRSRRWNRVIRIFASCF